MPFDAFRFKVFSRRVFIIFGLQILGFLLISIRLFKFQIIDYKYFKNKSDGNRIKTTILPQKRGLIKDINNHVVAHNTEYYRVVLKKTTYKQDMQSISKLSNILGFNKKEMFLKEYRRNKNLKEIILYRYLTRSELMKVEFNIPNLENISVGIGVGRVYSHPYAFSNLLGYVMQVPISELKKGKFISHPDIKIGAEGVEKIYDDTLIGKHGLQYSEVNVGGFKVSDIKTIPPTAGKDIKISFDSIIQTFAYELCKNKKASVVLMDVETGEIKVMLSTPSFDINLLSKKVDDTSWRDLLNDPNKPLINRPLQSAHSPGSIFKLITAIAGLEFGYNVNQKVKCSGKVYMLKRWRNCWLQTGHGELNLKNAIKHSCNITFYNLGMIVPINIFNSVASEFGIGEEFKNFEFKKQNIGVNPNDKWKYEKLKQRWYLGDTVNLSIGQGFLRCNALQLAVMMARIASLGKKVEPTLSSEKKVIFKDIEIQPAYINFVKNALFDATNTPGGTSYGSRIKERGMEFAGKTGTAQVISKFLENHQYNNFNRPHGIFAGFAPFESSKFAAAVIVENGGFGSAVAAPIGKNLLYFAQLIEKNRINEAKKFASSLGITALSNF